MIQFNLLPDVKLDYIRARRMKRTVLMVSTIAAGVSLFIFLSLFMVVHVAQKTHLKHLNDDIKADIAELKDTQDLDKVLTIQNQLKSLPSLHSEKPVSSRLFTYLAQITPAQITIDTFDIDFDQHTMNFVGSADSLSTVNTFADTLKFTTFSSDGGTEMQKAFSSVVMSNFGRSDKGATYEVTLSFNPDIFNSAKSITLTVPKTITTRSETEKPNDLFRETPIPTGTQSQ